MKRTAILIHGTGSSGAGTWERTGWLDLLESLSIHPTVVPLPGHRDSNLPPDAPIDRVLTDIHSHAPHFDTLIGFSAGASLALHVALSAPTQVRSLVLLGIGDGFWAETATKAKTADRLRSGGNDPFSRLMHGMITSSGNELERVCRFIETSPPPPTLETLKHLAVETLIVCGAEDNSGPPDMLACALPNATVVAPPRMDHFRTTLAPATMRATTRFLTRDS